MADVQEMFAFLHAEVLLAPIWAKFRRIGTKIRDSYFQEAENKNVLSISFSLQSCSIFQ